MEPTRYRDFPLQISRLAPKTRHYHVRVIGPVPGGQPGFNEQETRIYNPAIFLVESGATLVNLLEAMKNRRITALQLYQLGTILSDLLLPGSVRERLLQSLGIVRERKQRLRLRLIIEAHELVPLPWEYLYLKPLEVTEHDDLYFLALQSDISIVRHERIDQAEPRLEQRERYRLVAALAAPREQPTLRIEEDRRAIERMLGKVTTIGMVDPVWVGGATRQSLREALRQPADIFHFAGHGYFDGKIGQIILDKGDGKRSDFYNATPLAGLLRQAGVKLAILGACETAQRSDENIWGGVAPALVRAGIAAVVASQYRLQDRNALPLAEELYRGVLAGDSVDEAVYNARWSIYQQAGLENRDWGAPVLYLRVEDGIIFPRQTVPSGPFQIVPRIAPTPLLTPLIGRDDELATAQASLRNGGKYYFYGTYGVGKTSLMTTLFTQAVKEGAFADGHLWFRASDMDVERVLEWVASHFPGQKVAQVMGPTAKINALRELLAQRSDLLIGIDEVSDIRVIRALLEAAGNCTLLLNGARRCHLSGQAQELEFTPLTSDEAEQLFMNLANRSSATILGDEREVIRKICERMRYLPLAIKLAALKHAEGESLETLWERLERAPVTIIPEHEEVSTIFEAVYHDLQGAPAALLLLVRLVCFPALEAALSPLRANIPDLDFFQAKDKLVALGLVSTAGPDRLSLHPLLGLLAQQKADPQLMETERTRVVDWLLSYVQKNVDDYDALEREHQNLLGILDWLEGAQKQEVLITLTRYLFDYLRVRGHWQELHQRLNAALRAAQNVARHSDQALVHLHRGIISMLQGSYEAAKADFDQADLLYTQEDNSVGRGQVLYRRATLSALTGKLPEARQQFEQALELMGEEAPARDRAGAWQRLASIVAAQGDPAQARKHYHLALDLSRSAGDREGMANVYLVLGGLSRRAGDYNIAREHFQHASMLTKELGHLLDKALIEWELGYLDYYQGRYSEALAHFQGAYADFQQLRDKRGQAQTLHALANVALAQQDLDGAEEKYRAALSINSELNNVLGAAYNQYQLGLVAQRRQKRKEAEIAFRAALKDAESMKDVALQAASLHQLGTLALSANDWESAHQYELLAVDLANQVEDRLTALAARYQLGLLQAQAGNVDVAKDMLADVHSAFAALNAPEAAKVDQVLTELHRRPMTYRDFNLRIANYRETNGTFKVWIEEETPGGTMRPDDAPTCTYDPKAFWNDPASGSGGLLGDLERWRLNRDALFSLGKMLADLALPEGEVRNLFRQSLMALKEGEGLRVRLRIDPPALVHLPWEFMALPRTSGEPQATDFLALRREISIARTDTVETFMHGVPNRPIARVVGVLSSPDDQSELEVDDDQAAIEQAVQALNQAAGQHLIEVIWAERPATRDAVAQTLSGGADIFHFAGHAVFDTLTGWEGQIILEKDDYTSDFYSAERLAQQLHSAGIRLAVLGACETGRRDGQNVWSGVAPALTRQKIPAVIANQFKIKDDNAILIATKVYPRLLAGYTVDEALFEARQAIYLHKGLENRDWGVPVLYLRDGRGILFPRPEAEVADRVLAQPFLQIATIFNRILFSSDAEISRVTAGNVMVSIRIDVVEAGGTLTGLKIDDIG